MKYTWDWNVDYKAQGREICKECKNCSIGFPRKFVCCNILIEPKENNYCDKFEKRNIENEIHY